MIGVILGKTAVRRCRWRVHPYHGDSDREMGVPIAHGRMFLGELVQLACLTGFFKGEVLTARHIILLFPRPRIQLQQQNDHCFPILVP